MNTIKIFYKDGSRRVIKSNVIEDRNETITDKLNKLIRIGGQPTKAFVYDHNQKLILEQNFTNNDSTSLVNRTPEYKLAQKNYRNKHKNEKLKTVHSIQNLQNIFEVK